jgi:hypothetical protein
VKVDNGEELESESQALKPSATADAEMVAGLAAAANRLQMASAEAMPVAKPGSSIEPSVVSLVTKAILVCASAAEVGKLTARTKKASEVRRILVFMDGPQV